MKDNTIIWDITNPTNPIKIGTTTHYALTLPEDWMYEHMDEHGSVTFWDNNRRYRYTYI